VSAAGTGQVAGPKWIRGFPVAVAALVTLRFLVLAALPFETVFGYGDYRHFYDLARLAVDGGGGWPLIGHWIEFPPLFPYLSLLLYHLAGGAEHVYAYLLAALMTAFDAANLWLFLRIARRLLPGSTADRLTWIYMAFLALPAFGWWTFEPMAVFWMLLALDFVLADRPARAGLAAGLGLLTKVIPALVLVVAWRFRSLRQAAASTGVALAIGILGLAPFLAANPAMAIASLRAQAAKGSWETVWALLDGNLNTGSFGPVEEHLDAGQAVRARGNPALVPPWIPTLAIGALGLCLFVLADRSEDRNAVRFLALAFCLLFLWSRGWSPQWLAYFVPLLLLSLPLGQALGFGLNLTCLALLEWPVLLSRGRFDLLWVPVVLRTALLLLLAVVLAGRVLHLPGRRQMRGVA
jgi:hypothetical protein